MRKLDAYVERLSRAVGFARRASILRIASRPVRLLGSVCLQALAALLRTGFPVRARLFWDEAMTAVIPEAVSVRLFKYGYYEEGLTRMVMELLHEGMIFFDVGAHFGYYTLLASLLVGQRGRVHAFEPTPSTFQILQLNAAGKGNVVANNCAVFSRNGSVEMADYGREYSAFNSLCDSRLDSQAVRRTRAKKITAKAVTLDEYVKQKDVRPDFVKIDAENAEGEILRGAEHLLADMRPIVSLEVGDLQGCGGSSSRRLLQHLLDRGYEPYQYGGMRRPLVRHEIKELYDYDNLVFVPR